MTWMRITIKGHGLTVADNDRIQALADLGAMYGHRNGLTGAARTVARMRERLSDQRSDAAVVLVRLEESLLRDSLMFEKGATTMQEQFREEIAPGVSYGVAREGIEG